GVRSLRLRDGAYRWGLFNDPAQPARYVETFVVASWAEHLRQHERVTVADRETEDVARAFHVAATPPVVSHLISARHQTTHKGEQKEIPTPNDRRHQQTMKLNYTMLSIRSMGRRARAARAGSTLISWTLSRSERCSLRKVF